MVSEVDFSSGFIELVLDEREWAKKIKKIYRFMSLMDQQKHLPPKFSHAIDGLYVYLSEKFVSIVRHRNASLLTLVGRVGALLAYLNVHLRSQQMSSGKKACQLYK